MALWITTRHSGNTVQIEVRGEIDLINAYQLREEVNNVLSRSAPTEIVLDLWLVTFVDSVGIGALVACHQRAAVGGARLTVTRPNEFVHRQLWISGLLGLFGFPEAQPAVEVRPQTEVVERPANARAEVVER